MTTAILVSDVCSQNDTLYFAKYSEKIFTDHSDINFLDFNALRDPNKLEIFLGKHNIQAVLYVKKNEKIKLLNTETIEAKSNLVCLTDKKWIIKVPRFFSNKCNKSSNSCQNIILVQEEKMDMPILDDFFIDLKKLYKQKKYKEFVVEAEKWIFHNLEKTDQQLMIRYYCGLIYYFKLNNIKKSLEHLGVALIINPNMSELWCAWADILLDKKMYEKSKLIYKNAIISKKQRDIFDKFPIWLDRNSEYPEIMHKKINDSIKNIRTVKSIYNF